MKPAIDKTRSKVTNRRDTKLEVVSRFEDLPDFDAMSDAAVVKWWETHDVTPEVLEQLPGGEESEADFMARMFKD